MIVDATDLVLGRAASQIAKVLLEGEEVIVVNADKAVISGRKKTTLNQYDAWTKIKTLIDPTQGPFHPKNPGELLRRTVRGMLPMKKAKGRKAYDKLKAYRGVPSRFKNDETETFPKAKIENLKTRRFIRLGELSKSLKEGN